MFDIQNIVKYTSTLKLLYVEDNKDARELTLGILEDFFNNIVVACDGKEGLELFKKLEIDIVIIDINMPIMNGLEMISKIREVDDDLLIFILSAYNENKFLKDSIKLGVNGYLFKPMKISQFIEMLQKIVQKIEVK